MKLLFLYLKAFSFTGGIEKFNKSFLKALHELSVDGILDADAKSAYDCHTDERYFSRMRFKGFGGNKVLFTLCAIRRGWQYDVLVLGHLNLAFIGYSLKRIKPTIRLVIIAHGVEVWDRQLGLKKKALESADFILSVSNFTKQRILENNPTVVPDKIRIFPNTLDPYFNPPRVFQKPQYLLDRYHLTVDHRILLTVTRLSSSEKYKGYDNLIQSMPHLSKINPAIRYMLCGRAGRGENERLQNIINLTGTENLVTLTGFVQDDELIDHYLLADVFVMQSKKEGFGIVFIEALACGRKVIAGNADGSVDALLQGELGTLIDPKSQPELQSSILASLAREVNPFELQSKAIQNFGFSSFKKRLRNFLLHLNA